MDLDKTLLERETSQLRFIWRTIVREYTGLALTNPSDRLPALSGLAKQMRMNRAMTDYLAGMWRQTLLEDLLWYTVAKNPAIKSTPWLAPSWSWAAIDAEIMFASIRNGLWHATVLKAYCKPAGSDPTGRVSEGILVVNGPLVPAGLQLTKEVERGYKYSLKPYGKPNPEAEAEADPALSPQWRHTVCADYSLPEEMDERARSSAFHVYCLALVTDKEHEYIEPYFFKGNYYKHGTFYLVLRCIDETLQMYERIGLAWQEESFPGDEEKLRSRHIEKIRQETLSQSSSGNLFADTMPNSVITIL
ncbi:hypothetical protein DL768_011693 [Monosporascus sp. mg162]|nr:hypothetical protein DL768_011693 [Monosporascus sp. mg162]